MIHPLKSLALAIMLLGSITATAQNSGAETVQQRTVEAVMKAYEQALAEAPNDYSTRFARANQLYLNGDYLRALDDVNRVIQHAPASEKELLTDAYLLKARIHDQRNQLADELQAVNQALTLSPNSLIAIEMLGHVSYRMGDYQAAQRNYELILADNPRSYDAMYNLARVAAKQGDQQKAIDYVDQAVGLFPAATQVYINRAEVLEMLGDYASAAKNGLLALTTNDEDGLAVPYIYKLSNTHYAEVMSALDEAIAKAPRVATFYRLSSFIAMQHHHYGQALALLRSIMDNHLADNANIYRDIAYCHFALCDFTQAYSYIEKAIEKGGSKPDYITLKSRIIWAMTNPQNPSAYQLALFTLAEVDSVDATYTPATILALQGLISLGQNDQALVGLNRFIISNASNTQALMLRGFLYKYKLKKPELAQKDFQDVLLTAETDDYYRAFALHELGRDDEATTWMTRYIAEAKGGKEEAYYIGAILYSYIGDDAQALSYLEAALSAGYGNKYNITQNNLPYLHLRYLARNSAFDRLVDQHADAFAIK